MEGPGIALLKWVTGSVARGSSVVSAVGLRRGHPPWLVRLSNSAIEEVVVRVGDESTVDSLLTEAAALRAIADSAVPGPRLLALAMGDTDHPGVFALAMSALQGTSRMTAEPSIARLEALGGAIGLLHAAPVPSSCHLPMRKRPVEPVDFDAARRSQPSRPLLAHAEQLLRQLPVPHHPSVFVHGDFWHGNTIWDDERLAGIVDWECAGIGHPGIDLGMQRCDAALIAGGRASDHVLHGYESTTGRRASDVAYWDIVAALTTPPTMESFVAVVAGQGRTDLDAPTLLARRDDFLAAAIATL